MALGWEIAMGFLASTINSTAIISQRLSRVGLYSARVCGPSSLMSLQVGFN